MVLKGVRQIGLLLIFGLGILSMIGSGAGGVDGGIQNSSPSVIQSERFAIKDPGCTYVYFEDIEEHCLTYVENDQIKSFTTYTVVTWIHNSQKNTKAQSFVLTDSSDTIVGADQTDIIWDEPETAPAVVLGDFYTDNLLGWYMMDTWLVEDTGDRSYLYSYEINVTN